MTDPTQHELDDHVESHEPNGGHDGGFTTTLDDGARIKVGPDGADLDIEYGDEHPTDLVDDYAHIIADHLEYIA